LPRTRARDAPAPYHLYLDRVLFLIDRRPPRSPLLPYTTLFRSIFGFHAVLARLRADAASVTEIYLDEGRKDARARDLVLAAEKAGVSLMRVPTKRSEEHTSELQSLRHLVCRLLLEKKKKK